MPDHKRRDWRPSTFLSPSAELVVQPRKYTPSELELMRRDLDTLDHVIPVQLLCEKLGTNVTSGMSREEVARLLMENGLNTLTPPKITPEWIKFLKCMVGGFSALLWICAFICFILFMAEYWIGHPDSTVISMGVIIIIICIISGIFAYVQESKNNQIMDSFKQMVPTYAKVMRNGMWFEVPAEEIVIGDLVEIVMGDKVPADVRIIESRDLRVENSSITGESESTARTDYPTDQHLLESRNVAFFSSYAVAGAGKGIVIATGDYTMIGRLASLTSNLTKVEPPIVQEIGHFVHIVTYVAIFCGFLFFFLSLIVNPDIFLAFTYFLGIVISNVPESLPMTVTTSLTLTAKTMSQKNCLVKNLEAVETLGSTSAICSDKTGTITQNKMTVSNVWVSGTRYKIPVHTMMGAERDILMEKVEFVTIIKDATLCLRAEFKNKVPPKIPLLIEESSIQGDASETGILRFCERVHPTKSFRAVYYKVAEIPFNSQNKYQLSIHREEEGYNVIIKGAPEVIMRFCSKILVAGGETKNMLESDYEMVRTACTEMGQMGERVLAYCDYKLPASEYGLNYGFITSSPDKFNFPSQDYRFVGLISLLDPPRPFVLEAVHKCRTAGIKVIMVTGDHPVTAVAIAKMVGIIGEGHETRFERNLVVGKTPSIKSEDMDEAIVMTGDELRDMTSMDLDYVIKSYEEIVFARTSPQQKLQIVESCQRLGEIVAVTGDGVNDSPALRKADIGIAMGVTGSDVAKNAADMILMDDNFASIVTAVEEGRLIFDNLKKCIAYTLTSSIPEMIPMLASIVLKMPLPFILEMILCIDLGTDLLPAVALAYEKPESDIMSRAPRNPITERLVNKRLISFTYGQVGMTQACAGFNTFFMYLMYHGFLPQDVIGSRDIWENKSINSMTDSYGQTWDYQGRMDLLNEARTGYFLSITITQMIDLIMCKTRKNSIFHQGMDNWAVNTSFLFELLLTVILLYIPGTEKIFKTMPLDLFWYWPCLPHGIFLWVYDEMRRLIIRSHPGCFLERETYY